MVRTSEELARQTAVSADLGPCSACRWGRKIWDGGFSCHHPATAPAMRVPVAIRDWIAGSHGGALPLQLPGIDVCARLDVVEGGGFAWPFHFAADALVSCDGFQGKDR